MSQSVSLNPLQLSTLCKAFDAAWLVVKPEYDGSVESQGAGRLRVADAVLDAYQDGLSDAELITDQALDRLYIGHHE